MNRALPIGSTSVMVLVKLRDSTTGQLKASVAYGSVTYSYWKDGASSGATGTCVNATLGTYTDHGWKETSYAGMYQFGIPDGALSSGSGVSIKIVVSGAIDAIIDVQLLSVTRGFSGGALPDAIAGATGGLALVGSKVDLVDVPNSTAVAAIQFGLSTPGTPQSVDLGANAPVAWLNAAAFVAGALNGLGDWVTTSGPDAATISAQVWTDIPANAPNGWLDAPAFAAHALNGKGDWNTTTPPTAAAIATQVDVTLSAGHGGGAWGGAGYVGAGSGIITWPVTIEVASVVVPDVEVWVSTDATGTTIVAGPLLTSNFGVVTFYLNAGTYYLWREKAGYNFTNPQTMVVV